MIVADSSVIIEALRDVPAGAEARRRLHGQRVLAPHLIDIEVMSAIRRLCRAGHVTAGQSRIAIAGLARFRIERFAHRSLLDGIWQVRDNISAYDASYVSLAMNTGAPLITGDRRLARAAERWCDVELLASAD